MYITYARKVKLDQAVYILVGVYISHKKIEDSQGWHEGVQLPSQTGMIMFIDSASSFYLLPFLDTIRDMLKIITAVDSQYASTWALTPTCFGCGSKWAHPGRELPKHDVTERIMMYGH